MYIRPIIFTLFVTVFGMNSHADVIKWVDNEGNTHYSNKKSAKVSTIKKNLSRNNAKIIRFVEYKSTEKQNERIEQQIKNDVVAREELVKEESRTESRKEKRSDNNFTDVSGTQSFDELENTDEITHRIILDQINEHKSYIQRNSRNTRRKAKLKPEYSIAEYNQRCEDAREELIAPLRQEAIAVCMKMKQSMTIRTRDYCEDVNEDFGNGGMNSRGFYIQRMFHNIPECQQAYDAWERRSRKMRGYDETGE